MKKITNKILKKEFKKLNIYLYIFILFLALGALLIAIGIYENRQNNSSYSYLNDIIENKNNEENVNAYLNISRTPFSIAKYDDEENHAFYIVFDGTYFYIAYLSDELFNDLNVEGLEENPITIYGITTSTPEEVRKIALEVYNEGLDEENQITMDEFNNYFGEVYLNNTSLKKNNLAFYIISVVPFTISIIFLILFVIKKTKIKKELKKITKEDLEALEKEIEKESKYYQQYHLLLTKNYIISFNHNKFVILKYSDLIWIYEKAIKQYGITTAKNVLVMNQNGKNFKIITTDNTKDAKEIITSISNKNPNILIGLSKKNEEEIKKLLKNG